MAWDGGGTRRRRLMVSSKAAGYPYHSGMEERKAISQGWKLREGLPPPATPLLILPCTAQKFCIRFLPSLPPQLSQPSFPCLQLLQSLQPPKQPIPVFSPGCRLQEKFKSAFDLEGIPCLSCFLMPLNRNRLRAFLI